MVWPGEKILGESGTVAHPAHTLHTPQKNARLGVPAHHMMRALCDGLSMYCIGTKGERGPWRSKNPLPSSEKKKGGVRAKPMSPGARQEEITPVPNLPPVPARASVPEVPQAKVLQDY